MGADFFPERGENAPQIVIPPKIAQGEGILFALLEGGRGGHKPNFCRGKNKNFCKNIRKKSKVNKQNKGHLFT